MLGSIEERANVIFNQPHKYVTPPPLNGLLAIRYMISDPPTEMAQNNEDIRFRRNLFIPNANLVPLLVRGIVLAREPHAM